jgi:hypothetical protein
LPHDRYPLRITIPAFVLEPQLSFAAFGRHWVFVLPSPPASPEREQWRAGGKDKKDNKNHVNPVNPV